MSSVENGTEAPFSDLDLLVLGQYNKFESEFMIEKLPINIYPQKIKTHATK
jgi:hypothetical protein